MDDVFPNAQGPQSEDADDSQSNPLAGVQKRIDELTAKFHDNDRQWQDKYTQVVEQNRELLRTMAMRSEAMAPAEPEPELDPDDKQRLDYFLKRATAPLQQHITQLEGMMYASQIQQAAAARGITDPAIVQEAAVLVQRWQQAGHLRAGVATLDDALRLVVGEHALRGGQRSAQGQAQTQQFNSMANPITTSNAPPVGGQPAPRKEISMDDIERDPLSALRVLEQRINGQEF
jgi:hypothetical protein